MKNISKGCNIQGLTSFEYNSDTMTYEVLESRKQVDKLLNEEAITQGYGMLWTEKLELGNILDVTVSGLFSASIVVVSGTPFGRVQNLSLYFSDEEYGIVSKDETRIVCDATYVVTTNMSIIVGHWVNVTVGHPFNKTERMVTSETIQQVSRLFNFEFDDYIVMSKNTNETLYKSTMIENNTVIALCYELQIEGVFNETFIIESGTPIGDCGNMSIYFNEKYGVVDGKSETRIVFNSSHQIVTNMTIIIIKKVCVTVGSPFNKELYLFPGDTLGVMEDEYHLQMDNFTVLNRTTRETLNKLSVFDVDTGLMLCHDLYTYGELNNSYLIEHNATLLTISDVVPFLNSSFIIFDVHNTTIVYMNDTRVVNDTILVIKRASKQDLLLEFEEWDEVSEETVKKAVRDMIGSRNEGDKLWIDVSPQDGGSFIVSVTLIEEESFDVADSLRDCSRS